MVYFHHAAVAVLVAEATTGLAAAMVRREDSSSPALASNTISDTNDRDTTRTDYGPETMETAIRRSEQENTKGTQKTASNPSDGFDFLDDKGKPKGTDVEEKLEYNADVENKPEKLDPFSFLDHDGPPVKGFELKDDSDPMLHFMAGKTEPHDPAIELVRDAVKKVFEFYEPFHVDGGVPPPGFPGLPMTPTWSNEPEGYTREGSFWTQRQPLPYTDDWSELLNYYGESKDKRGKEKSAAAAEESKQVPKDLNPGEEQTAQEEQGCHRQPRSRRRAEKKKEKEDAREKQKGASKPAEEIMGYKPDWNFQDAWDTKGTWVPAWPVDGKEWEKEVEETRKGTGINNPPKPNPDDYAIGPFDDYGHGDLPIVGVAYPPPEPQPTIPSVPPLPYDPTKRPTHPPGGLKEREDFIRRRLFQTPLTRAEYEKRNWNWMRCATRKPGGFGVPMVIEAGGLWVTENGEFLKQLKRHAGIWNERCYLDTNNVNEGLQVAHWNGQGWGDMTAYIWLRDRYEGAINLNGGCDVNMHVLDPAKAALIQLYNSPRGRKVLYVHGCGGPHGNDTHFPEMAIQIPNEVVYSNSSEQDLARFKGVENLPYWASPPTP